MGWDREPQGRGTTRCWWTVDLEREARSPVRLLPFRLDQLCCAPLEGFQGRVNLGPFGAVTNLREDGCASHCGDQAGDELPIV